MHYAIPLFFFIFNSAILLALWCEKFRRATGYLFPVVKHLLERAETAEGKLKDLEARIAALEGVKA